MADIKKEIIYNGNKYVLETEDNYIVEKDIKVPMWERDKDPVNSPNHYKQGNRETIEVIRDYMTNDEFCGYLKGNIIKYLCRFEHITKEPSHQSLEKAKWYLDLLIERVKDENRSD